MAWHGIVGHDDVVERFRLALRRGRLASSFLFVGPAGIGKRTFALKLAQALLCPSRSEDLLDPCEQCPACLQVLALTHPDLELVAKPEDKSFIPLELLIGDREHRARRGLCHSLSLKPFMGGRKIAIIDDADYLHAEGANSLLKTLEEPPPRSVLILIGTSPAKQLPTIRSRCQMICFRPLAPTVLAELLVSEGLVESRAEARRLAAYSNGSVQDAMELADPALWAFRSRIYHFLAEPVLESVRVASELAAFLEEAGKEGSARRNKARRILQFAVQFYRHLLHALAGCLVTDDAELRAAVQRAAGCWRGDTTTAAACLDHTLAAAEQIDRNVHQALLLEYWLDGLAEITPARRE